ncbi:PCI domain containing protein [Tritrichomonas foetus]|uniref:PCI domain containing protein n=1 Tax=Tritrichomonas foetus TaxID=1144522 RepID=A0A1J4JUD4_9EUKA|nr:PCI domain containing protein [Tritrichomonas foetus]|eukprot:OHT02088.1 PCI domain containing protein [Tritrichomonas foetus]
MYDHINTEKVDKVTNYKIYFIKMTEEQVNLTPLVEEQLPTLLALPFEGAIEGLHALERKTRIAKDDNANCLVCSSIINLCVNQERWEDLGTNVSILAKRRGYSRKSVSSIVGISMDTLKDIKDENVRINLIKILRDVTEGKIFVEVERARLTSILVEYLESKGDLNEAMNLLQDLRLEILTTMDEKERVDLMLHQFKLCLDCKDQLRASLCAEKIHDQRLKDPELKHKFLELLIIYHNDFTKDYMEIAKAHYEVFKITNDSSFLMNSIVNAVLAPHSPEQLQFCNELFLLKDLALLPQVKLILSVFMGQDLVPWPEFESRFAEVINDDNREVMRRRVIEHGLRVVSHFYTNIRLQRLAELLQLSVDELEERIIDLVFNEDFYSKINRPKGIVTFKKQQKVSEVADEFSADIMKLCKLVDQAHSLIEKEKQNIQRVKV